MNRVQTCQIFRPEKRGFLDLLFCGFVYISMMIVIRYLLQCSIVLSSKINSSIKQLSIEHIALKITLWMLYLELQLRAVL